MIDCSDCAPAPSMQIDPAFDSEDNCNFESNPDTDGSEEEEMDHISNQAMIKAHNFQGTYHIL